MGFIVNRDSSRILCDAFACNGTCFLTGRESLITDELVPVVGFLDWP